MLLCRFFAFPLLVLFVVSAIPPSYASAPLPVVSYNPYPLRLYHAPLSQVGIVALTHSYRLPLGSLNVQAGTTLSQGGSTVPAGLTRFIKDQSYMPQSETTVSVDPSNTNHVVGGYNDARYFLCPLVSTADCPSGYTNSLSGFSVSNDSGRSVMKSDDIPELSVVEKNINTSRSLDSVLVSWGDPYVGAAPDGSFYYTSLAIDPNTGVSGVMVAKSNGGLWDPFNACATPTTASTSNPCWSNALVYGNLTYYCVAGACGGPSFDDKDTSAIDMDASSPYYGSIYVSWDHFSTKTGLSSAYVARCNPSLSCVMISGDTAPVVSGTDKYAGYSTVVVGPEGTVYLSWCDFGTATTFGPVTCKVSSSPPGGNSFGPVHVIMSFMGAGTTLPGASILQAFATEQFRTSSVPTMVAGTGKSSDALFYAVSLCTSGRYFIINANLTFPTDNPGVCGASQVFLTESADGGADWASPVNESVAAVIAQPSLTFDPATGALVLAYYTSQFDPFNHRLDVIVAVSTDRGLTFTKSRVTPVSDEPNSDPALFDYLSAFGGSLVVPQYGDYMQADAYGGMVWVLFTGNYAVEEGTLQSDPFLVVSSETPTSLTITGQAVGAPPGTSLGFAASGLSPASNFTLSIDWNGVAVTLAKGVVTADGQAKGSFTVPNVESRVYIITASDSKGFSASSQIAVGQVSLAPVEAALSDLQGRITSVSQAIAALNSTLGEGFVSLRTSLSSAQSAMTSSIAGLDSRISGALTGASSTLLVIEYLAIAILAIAALGLAFSAMASRRKPGSPAV